MPKLNAAFNRTQPKNRTISVIFDKPEIVEVTCDLHPWMKAWVVVAAHPFYAITGAGTANSRSKTCPPGSIGIKPGTSALAPFPGR